MGDGMANEKFRQDRKLWYRGIKRFLRIKYRRPRFIFLGDKPKKESIILSNHVGSYAPISLEIYANFPIRLWGTHEMNSGLKKLYQYQTRVYFHQKKGWNIHLVRLVCLIISPLTNLFYKGLRLISTYEDHRLRNTLKKSVEIIENNENIVIFPENSSNGYHEILTEFHRGFTSLAKSCLKKGIDLLIYVSYLRRKERVYLFDKPIPFSELKKIASTKEEMANYLLNRCNDLGKLDLKTMEY